MIPEIKSIADLYRQEDDSVSVTLRLIQNQAPRWAPTLSNYLYQFVTVPPGRPEMGNEFKFGAIQPPQLDAPPAQKPASQQAGSQKTDKKTKR